MNNSRSLWQFEHLTRLVRSGLTKTGASQTRHLNIMVFMKPLALILLLAVTAECQSLAEIARQERERQARVTSTRVITVDGRSSTTPAAETQKPPASPTEAPAKPAEKPVAVAPPPPAPVPAADPVQQWNGQMQMLGLKIRELEDQERTFQAQVMDFTNQLNAPVSDQDSNNQALVRLGDAQNKLMGVRAELDQTKKDLAAMVLQGPPKK